MRFTFYDRAIKRKGGVLYEHITNDRFEEILRHRTEHYKSIDGVTLSIEEGEFVAIVGTSGSGKSTLLNMMGGLDTPTSGSIKVKGKELSKLKDEQLTIFRRRNIGFIFQNYNLVPVLNVYENIVLRWSWMVIPWTSGLWMKS